MQFQVLAHRTSNKLRPYFPVPIPAGPGQTIDQDAEWINIDEFLRGGNDSVSYVRAVGHSMSSQHEAGINDGDILAVQRIGFAQPGEVVIARVNGEFTIKRLRHRKHELYLVPANENYPIRRVDRDDDFEVWAVVKYVIHKMRRAA